jgi:NADH-quinone oxidoreductase subunit E
MSEQIMPEISQLISAAGLKHIDHWIEKYPADQRQSAVMAALMVAQDELGHLTPTVMDAIAAYLHMPPIAVYEVSSFYTMYEHQPCGRHLINVCTNISCKLRDSASIIQHLEQTLGIKTGETTADGRFTLRSVECLGACVNAPMMQINKDYHEHLTADTIDAVLKQYE